MSITTPYGFTASGIRAGLKTRGKDLALVHNTGPLKHAAAVFTTNTFAAAPVLWSRQVISDGRADAVVLNSGGANACTGPEGFQDTHATAERVAEALTAAGNDVSATDVLVCSTGLIGERLNMKALLPGVDTAVQSLSAKDNHGWDAAHAIMTTDTVPKTSSLSNEADTFSIGGMAKGAGMLAPGMATMLAVITTDAVISQPDLDAALREAVRISFNRADSDGCMSTNDTVIAMASGAHPNADQAGVDLTEFQTLLNEICQGLAESLIEDAEGHRHVISIDVVNAPTEEEAETAGRAVARSNLFKTAIYGRDPNWGRILSAVGTTDIAFDPAQVSVSVNGVWVCRNGGIGEDRALVEFPTDARVEIIIDLGAGDAEATILTNDLTHDYVHENSAYSS